MRHKGSIVAAGPSGGVHTAVAEARGSACLQRDLSPEASYGAVPALPALPALRALCTQHTVIATCDTAQKEEGAAGKGALRKMHVSG